MTEHFAGHSHDDSHRVNYLVVFVALCVFTLISILADVIHIPSKAVLIVIVLAVATAKALSVMLYFMHLKFERNWKYVLLAPTIILAIGIPLALMPDIGLHYYTEDVPQLREAPVSHGAGHDEHAGAPEDAGHTKPAGEVPKPADH